MYSVIEAFGITRAPVAHALKKLLCLESDSRHDKATRLQDLNEALDALYRAREQMVEEMMEQGGMPVSMDVYPRDVNFSGQFTEILTKRRSPTAPPTNDQDFTQGSVKQVGEKDRMPVLRVDRTEPAWQEAEPDWPDPPKEEPGQAFAPWMPDEDSGQTIKPPYHDSAANYIQPEYLRDPPKIPLVEKPS